MKTINLSQRSDEWHDYRKNGIGSSDIAAIMGLSRYRDASDVYKEKTEEVKNVVNYAMQRGIDYEEEARLHACKLLSMDFIGICIEDDTYPFMRASLDGYSWKKRIVLEIKTPMKDNYENYTFNVPEDYFCQIQWQMMLCDALEAYLCVYSPEKKEAIMHMIMPSKVYQDMLKKKAIEFWEGHVVPRVPPAKKYDLREVLDVESLTLSEELEFYVSQRKTLEDSLKYFKDKEEELKGRLVRLNPVGSFKCRNLIFKCVSGRTSLDKELMIQDGIDLSKYEKKGKESYRVELA